MKKEIKKFLNSLKNFLSRTKKFLRLNIFSNLGQEKSKVKNSKKKPDFLAVFSVVVFFLLGICGGLVFDDFLNENFGDFFSRARKDMGLPDSGSQQQNFELSSEKEFYSAQSQQEKLVISAVKKSSPAVVSIAIFKEVPVYKEYYITPFEDFFGGGSPFQIQIPEYRQEGTERKQMGSGTGFIVSSDGLVLTNKHVVMDNDADYTIITAEGKSYPVKVLAKDPFQDLAVLKIDRSREIDANGNFLEEEFPILKLGNSDFLEIGQTVIAIGNALGEFSNTVSVGVISGLSRKITASGNGLDEILEDIIQTDAAINPGNSGGPLLNLKNEVIGINVAIAESAQNISFSIPINRAKRDILQVKAIGKIVYPFLGIRYVLITPEIKKEKNLQADYGALLVQTQDGPAVISESAAEKAGLKEEDVILKINGEKITSQNSPAQVIQKKLPGEKIILEILREGKSLKLEAVLDEKTS